MYLSKIAELTGYKDFAQLDCLDLDLKGFCIDSRKVQPGFLFVALQGNKVDGHKFMHEAENKGAVAILCSQANTDLKIAQFVVEDPIITLAKIATDHRRNLNCPVIALTGSNGKTTVKEMITNILPKPSYSTLGNLNNHLGVPLSVLQTTAIHRYAVFELGANHLGDINYTAAIAKPDVALINNIGPAHLGEFGSMDTIASAKGEIYRALSTSGKAIINDDDLYAHFWDKIIADKEKIGFSAKHPATVHAQSIKFDEQYCANFTLVLPIGTAKIKLQIPGKHSLMNALAAAACCYAVGIPLSTIVNGLELFQGVRGRMTYLQGKKQALVIDDTYNANLDSVLAAIAVLAKRQGTKILVLGDLNELGIYTKRHHAAIGKVAKQHGIDLLITYGVHSKHAGRIFGSRARHYNSQKILLKDLEPLLDPNITILVKGSRAAAMEHIVAAITIDASSTNNAAG